MEVAKDERSLPGNLMEEVLTGRMMQILRSPAPVRCCTLLTLFIGHHADLATRHPIISSNRSALRLFEVYDLFFQRVDLLFQFLDSLLSRSVIHFVFRSECRGK